ncbi:MAG: hypothetical protein RL497_868 [Pseudomonadota bacterium]
MYNRGTITTTAILMYPFMSRSISQRVFIVVLFSMLSISLSTLILALWQVEALEGAAINTFASAEIEYFMQNGDKHRIQDTQSSHMISVYIPHADTNVKKPPVLFNALPVPFQGEVDSIERTYAVVIHPFPEGTLYYAQDLALIENIEYMAFGLLLAAAIVTILISFCVAIIAARYVSKPINILVEAIEKTQHSNSSEPLRAQQFNEQELQSICNAINQFSQKIQAATAREKSWMAMASHEFRTPLSIIAGAVNVLQKRDGLSVDDNKTLARIDDACSNMTGYVAALLAIARRAPLKNPQKIDFKPIIIALADEYSNHNPQWPQRINHQTDNQQPPLGDVTVAKIVLDNLLTNALNHSEGTVNLIIHTDHLIVADESTSISTTEETQGLGLYIVNMACDYLGWRFEVVLNANCRTSIVWFN